MKHWIQAALAAAVIGAAVPAQAETISVTLQLPETHYLAKNWEDFGKIISEKSGGDRIVEGGAAPRRSLLDLTGEIEGE